jgi:putative phosphoserine phosphatase/1-acylglycerol-3-phosphate O-acyltransferase
VASGSRARRPGAADLVRTVAALLAILPGLVVGVAVLLATGKRRRAINSMIEVWGDLGTRAAGIRLDVGGAEHLRLRPAVFVFNHQSGIDPILLCALLRRDFVGVAKAEIRSNPILGPAFAFAGVVFVDRSDRAQALRALAPAVDTLRAGIAIAIAPEGTRSPGAEIGAFKKGAFRIALAARVPIVPIVILNARDVLPRGARVMTPATVRVIVRPPVSTEGWTLAALDVQIESVRRIFAETLAQAGASRSTTTATDRV